MAESSLKERKTLWEKEKLLVTSNFSFFHTVFKRFILQIRKNMGMLGKGLKGICLQDTVSNISCIHMEWYEISILPQVFPEFFYRYDSITSPMYPATKKRKKLVTQSSALFSQNIFSFHINV